MPNQIIVEVDEDLADLIPDFMAHKREDLAAILAAAARGEYSVIGRLAHRLKGEGGSYGFAKMTELGAAIGRAADAHDATAITAFAHELIAYLDCVEVVFHPARD